mmetsp:Transcript_110774/g.313417  ORF Transcript_110774/g.313417 Transcript_110774/m.313417 type:complete len:406 (+) Transcript_110774:83-1300(+)
MVLFAISAPAGRARKDHGPEADKHIAGSSAGAPEEALAEGSLVAVPFVTLTAKDCDPRQAGPPPPAALTDRLVEVEVPEGSLPGCTLAVPVGRGARLEVALPEHATVGDTVQVCQRADGSWRVSKKATRFSFVMPEGGRPGDSMRLDRGPDGFPMAFQVPQDAWPGDIITLYLTREREWDVVGKRRVDTPDRTPLFYGQNDWDELASCYKEVLGTVRARVRSSRALAGGGEGTVRVSVPLCGRFAEYAVLGNFVSEHLLGMPGVTGGSILATGTDDQHLVDWAKAHRWFGKHLPRIQLETYAVDLSQDSLPEADITIVVHPEVTKGGAWFPTIGSIIRSRARGGLAFFATFYRCEADTVVNMVRMYAGAGTCAEVVGNPWYSRGEVPTYPPMRYLVIVYDEHVTN